MKSPAILLLSALCFVSCAGMKDKFAEMGQSAKNAGQKAADTANAEAARHDPNRPWDGPKTPGQAASAAKNAAGAAAAAARGEDPRPASSDPGSSESSATASGAAGQSSSNTEVAGTSASAASEGTSDAASSDPAMEGGTEVESGEVEGGEVEVSSGDAGTAVDMGYTVDCTVPQNKPEDVEGTGKELLPGPRATKGWFTKTRYQQGLEMSMEVKDERERSYLQETRTFQNGQLIACQLMWVSRYYDPVDPSTVEHQIDYETKTTDLPGETVTINGRDVACKVQKVWTRIANQESTTIVWTSDEIPFGTVKMAQETKDGPVVVYELLEFRR